MQCIVIHPESGQYLKSIYKVFDILSNVIVFKYIVFKSICIWIVKKSICIQIHFNAFDPMSDVYIGITKMFMIATFVFNKWLIFHNKHWLVTQYADKCRWYINYFNNIRTVFFCSVII